MNCCAEWSVYDIKVSRERFESLRICLLPYRSHSTLMSFCRTHLLVVLVMCLVSHWLVLVMWPSLFDINSPHVAFVLCLALYYVTCCQWVEFLFMPSLFHMELIIWQNYLNLNCANLNYWQVSFNKTEYYVAFNTLGARVFWKKCWILTSRFQKLVAWKGLKIEIYCKLEKCWAWTKVYVGCKYTHLICILWRHQGVALLNLIIFRK